MGTEIEIKLEAGSQDHLDTILRDPEIIERMEGALRPTPMATIYYDTPDYTLSRRRWTLRLRREGETSVATVKIPLGGQGGFSARGEWQAEAPTIQEGIRRLLEAGAPPALEEMTEPGVMAICGAEFTRRTTVLAFSDGSRTELAADSGVLTGKDRKLPFWELELELLSGQVGPMQALADYLARTYQAAGQPLSKFARAAQL